jgi:hypothetical protein
MFECDMIKEDCVVMRRTLRENYIFLGQPRRKPMLSLKEAAKYMIAEYCKSITNKIRHSVFFNKLVETPAWKTKVTGTRTLL